MVVNTIESLAARFESPKFYVQLKLMRLGEDLTGIESSIKEDMSVVKKIASDTGQKEAKVRHDFFMQLQAYRPEFERWNSPVTPEEMVLKGLRPFEEKRYVGAKPKLAVLLEMGKPQKSTRNSTYRRVTFLVESDIPGSAWELIRTNLWGSAPDVKVGEACHVILENNQGYMNVKHCESTDASELPNPIPGDPRYRIQKLGASIPRVKKGTRDDGSDYEFEVSFLTMLVQNPEDPESTIVLEANSTFAQRWQEAPNDKILNTIITQANTERGTFYNVGDWQESKDQNSLAWPDVDTLIDFSPEIIADHVGGYVILDGTPTSIMEKEGAKGPFYVIEIHNFLTQAETSMMLRENAFLDGGVLELIEGRPYFLANRVKILVRVSTYTDQNGKERISKNALAIWNMDSVLPDLPEDLGIEDTPEVPEEIQPEQIPEAVPEQAKETIPEQVTETAPEEPPVQEETGSDVPVDVHSHDLPGEVKAPLPVSAQVQTDAPQTLPVQEAPASTSEEKSVPKKAGGLFQKKLPEAAPADKKSEAPKGAITSSEQQRIDALRSRLAAQKGNQSQVKAETPL